LGWSPTPAPAAVTHHDPDHDDAFLLRVEEECQKRFPRVVLAREKMAIEL
jgi:hypothetical protein